MLIYVYEEGVELKIITERNFDRELKKLKKRYEEKKNYEKIREIMIDSKDYNQFRRNPIIIAYGIEKLKYNLNEYYSINLYKNGGKIRLLFKIDENNNIIILGIISEEHYKDVKI